MKTEIEKCLTFDPFEGDFGEAGDKTISDAVVKFRKAGPCNQCGKEIAPGSRGRRRTGRVDGMLMSYRWCAKCSQLMADIEGAASSEEDFDRLDALNDQWEAAGLQRDAQPATPDPAP